ncbi:10240_t:CDS:2 [Paraglomus occultum]|uniref:10240_t:CDS:1 n=1 Tax=Paraglomus occultum TaxID=144539 RepID=A0A9N8ZU29_9GLOM|nr:10240_t:CDS:2 [Paraglomus occultum]
MAGCVLACEVRKVMGENGGAFLYSRAQEVNEMDGSNTEFGELKMKLPHPSSDKVSALAFSPVANFLAVSSWDKYMKIYEVDAAVGVGYGRLEYKHEFAVLCCAWSKDGLKLVSAGANKAGGVQTGLLVDLTTQQHMQIAQHVCPIKTIKWVDNQVFCTGSWDKTVKCWDTRTPTPVLSIPVPERVYAMDLIYPFLVIGTAERHVVAFDLTNPSKLYKWQPSPLQFQTTAISFFMNATGYAIGSMSAVGIQYLNKEEEQLSFSFECHREGSIINAISFHPLYGTFSTAGSDGTVNFWDKDSQRQLQGFPTVGCPISASTFNRDGTIFAYAASYDWSAGYLPSPPGNHTVYLRRVGEEVIPEKMRRFPCPMTLGR